MGLSVSQLNSSYSRVLNKQSEYSGRLAIQKIKRFKRLGIEPQNIFFQIVKITGIPQIDLFASRLSYRLPKYMSWHPDPCSCGVDSLHHSWRNIYGYAFPPFCSVGKVLTKVRKDQSLLIITPAWQTQPWYAVLLSMLVQHPIILTNLTILVQDPMVKSTLCW